MKTELDINSINFHCPDLSSPIIIIIGPPGAGKTEVGSLLAKQLGWTFYDSDILIENATSMKISEIFAQYGEPAFRQLEKALIHKLLDIFKRSRTKSVQGTILSCGGGLPIPSENFTNLAKLDDIIYLYAEATLLLQRISHMKHRPLLDSKKDDSASLANRLLRLETLIFERKDIYAKAKYKIDTANQSIEDVVTSIRILLKL